MSTVIRVENVSKQYRLGQVGTGSLAHDVNRWWHTIRGKEDPYLKIGEVNDRTKKAESGKQKAEMGENGKAGKSQLSAFNSQLSSASADYAWALRDVSFEVKEGEILGIIGQNGAGKSTLLKILSRVTTPTTGEIKVKGRIASLLEVGTGFHPELTGRENIFLNGAILGMRKHEIAAKFDEIVDFSGCERYIDTPVKRYSSGMYVRLAFGVAAHLESEILVIDEVLAVGDAEFQKRCLGKMKDLAGDGRTVLFVSHNMAAVSGLTNRCVVIKRGGVTWDGPTSDAIDYHLNEGRDHTIQSDDVSCLPRLPYGNGDATILTLGFSDSTGILKIGEDLGVRMKCRSTRDLNRVQFHMTINSSDGLPVGTTSSREHISLASGKDASIQLLLPNPSLAPGRYFCDVSLISGDRFDKQDIYEVLPAVLYFEISSVFANNEKVIHWNQGWGRVLLPDLQIKND